MYLSFPLCSGLTRLFLTFTINFFQLFQGTGFLENCVCEIWCCLWVLGLIRAVTDFFKDSTEDLSLWLGDEEVFNWVIEIFLSSCLLFLAFNNDFLNVWILLEFFVRSWSGLSSPTERDSELGGIKIVIMQFRKKQGFQSG